MVSLMKNVSLLLKYEFKNGWLFVIELLNKFV